MAKDKTQQPDAVTETVNARQAELLKQLGASINLMREELRQTTGEASNNAASALAEMRKYKDVLKINAKSKNTLEPEQAARLLRAVNESRNAILTLQKKNGKAVGNRGSDGKTITERLRDRDKQLATQESVVGVLREINERRENANDQKSREYRNIKDTFRQGLSAFLGPAGPLVETFFKLKEEYGEDAKKIGGKIARWLKIEKDLLKEYEQESGRSDRRDRKLFDMMGDKFSKFGNLLGNLGGGLLDKLGGFFGFGGKGKGKGGALTRAKRAARKLPGVGKVLRGGALGRGAGRLLGGAGKIGGKLLGFGSKLLGPLGVAMGLASIMGDKDAGAKGEGALDTGVSYGGGALTGATAGAMIGSVFPVVGTAIGGAIGAVVGLLFTGIVRNWTAFKTKISDTWDGMTGLAKTAWGRITLFGSEFSKFTADTYENLSDGFKKTVSWLRDNVPGFDRLLRFAENLKTNAGAAIEAGIDQAKATGQAVVQGATTAAKETGAAVVQGAKAAGETVAAGTKKAVAVTSQKAQQIGAAVSEGATDAKIAVAGAVEKGAQRVADVTETAAADYEASKTATGADGSGPGLAKRLKGAAAATLNKSSQGVADFSGAVGGRAIMERQMTASGIVDPKERAMMLAQLDHESGLRARSENLNYSSVDRLDKTFGKNKAFGKLSPEQKAQLVNNPEALANTVYGNRMGNTDAGDGYKFRGRGMIQVTGKANYEKYGKLLGVDLVANPELANDPKIAAQIATAYWKENKLGKAAQAGDVKAVTQAINGGQNGAADRESKYAKYLAEGKSTPQIATAATPESVTKTAGASAVANVVKAPGTKDSKVTSAGVTPPVVTSSADGYMRTSSVAPSADGYARAESVAPSANMSMSMPQQPTQSNGGQILGGGNNQQTRTNDIPMVLGDNHMVVINAGMMGA